MYMSAVESQAVALMTLKLLQFLRPDDHLMYFWKVI